MSDEELQHELISKINEQPIHEILKDSSSSTSLKFQIPQQSTKSKSVSHRLLCDTSSVITDASTTTHHQYVYSRN
jgi:hypothetical protein